MPKLRKYEQKLFVACVEGHRQQDPEKKKWLKFRNNVDNENYIKNRVDRLFLKEKETIAWIRKFAEDSIFFDVGANIGIYCLYSAKIRKNTVYAFEPHMGNYINLLDNINENRLYNCQAFPLALGDKMNLTTLGVKNMIEGVSDSNVGETSEYYHGCVEMSMDWLVEQGTLPQPDHIKIDVDGHEGKVVDGAIKTISKCKSVLVELDLEKHMATYEKILDTGLTLRTKINRNEHTGSQLYNMIFQKGWTGGVTTDPNKLSHA